MNIMDKTNIRVSDVHVGTLIWIKDRIFAGVKEIEEGQGVRTLHVFGYNSRTLASHQFVTVGKF